jgi:hypothetical protein
MTKKAKVAEIFSKALHNDNPDLYLVGYLDFNETKQTTLLEFFRLSENFELIPASRITYIKRENTILYSKFASKKG